ncbi:hypothetical protein OH76DRAFT_201062 [Lentinus brumalis]|uniref:Uncharacterized protein n=1 Tax=Lentinus brumalis TaxID=2498619 RepID=A0A371DIA7_9APHY|nr:hypothetical protein OH76DRAFT_201062 [Polyporus brumalis]
MLSECKIDGTVLAQFRSPDVIPRPAYRQSFFVSEAFSIGRHQLAIRNPGGDFYFDAIILKFPASSTSLPSVIPTASTASPVPPQSISPVSPNLLRLKDGQGDRKRVRYFEWRAGKSLSPGHCLSLFLS